MERKEHPQRYRRWFTGLALVLVLALVAAACGSGSEETTTTAGGGETTTTAGGGETTTTAGGGETTTTAMAAEDLVVGDTTIPASYVADAMAAAVEAAHGQQLTGSVTVEGHNGGFEADLVTAFAKIFGTATGVDVEYVGGSDLAARVETEVRAGSPPDVVQDSTAGNMRRYAAQGQLLALDSFMDMNTIQSQFSPSLLSAMTVDGHLYGVLSALHPQMIWYNPAAYDGPLPPASFDDMVSYAEQLAASGQKPFCMALEAGPNTGFPDIYLVEEIFAKMWGGDALTKWGTGEIAWDSPEVKAAFEAFGKIGTKDEMVYPSVDGALTTNIAEGVIPLYQDPPQCTYYSFGEYTEGFIKQNYPDLKPVEGYDFFPLPAPNPDYAGVEQASGWTVFAFNDRPEVRAFMEYWASPGFQALLAYGGRGIVANNQVSLDAYNGAISKKAAQQLLNADDVALGPWIFASSDLKSAYTETLINYMQDPTTLDSSLAHAQEIASQQ